MTGVGGVSGAGDQVGPAHGVGDARQQEIELGRRGAGCTLHARPFICAQTFVGKLGGQGDLYAIYLR
jgi:hypothetical protein